jgi:hypothetical protein
MSAIATATATRFHVGLHVGDRHRRLPRLPKPPIILTPFNTPRYGEVT